VARSFSASALVGVRLRVAPRRGVKAAPASGRGHSHNDGGSVQPAQRRVLTFITLVLLTSPCGQPVSAQTTERVSVASDGTQANGVSGIPAISADGRFVAFESDATNLVPGDTNDVFDVFVHDRQTGTTARVRVASDGTQANSASVRPATSADRRLVAAVGSATNLLPADTHAAH